MENDREPMADDQHAMRAENIACEPIKRKRPNETSAILGNRFGRGDHA
jgi:hypothetical protein